MAHTPLHPNEIVVAVGFGVPLFKPYVLDVPYSRDTTQGLCEFGNRLDHINLLRHIEE